ncbi:MAG: DUF1549 and DUF1553 domain-containing protein [Planctomycetaceae bacterium]
MRSLLLLLAVLAGGSTTVADNRPARAAAKAPHANAARRHWAFQVPKRPRVPMARSRGFARSPGSGWLATPIDAFILRKLTKAGLRPSPTAERRTLIRRLYFDLLGLPPTPDQVRQFLRDESPDAYPRLVDRLLADPRYGERWAQHWLDVVRYSESEGFEYDRHRPGAWRYRDYVIRSFNADKPYDRFVTEQIAGDEVSFPGTREQKLQSQAYRDARIAAGFYRLGPVRRNAGNADVAFSRNEVLTEMTDAVGATFLGLTVGCARCHDHMFDPFPQKDYYRLQAFLAATHADSIPLTGDRERRRWEKRTADVTSEIAAIKDKLLTAEGDVERKLRAELKAANARLPAPPPLIFTARNVPARRTPIHLLKRGDEFQKGPKLGMRLPALFFPNGPPRLPADTPRPKTRLAQWITGGRNPLTARVIVNRIWQYHFGMGLVETSNDFGLNGSDPSHPKLLDWLATELMRNGWRIKPTHRLILLSRTYRQSSKSRGVSPRTGLAGPGSITSITEKRDPENRLLWRFPRRRLDAEQLRDAMLAVAGVLHQKQAGPSVMVPVDPDLIALLYKPTQWQVTRDPREHDRRSVYLFAKRNLRVPFLEVFDQPGLQTSCFRRTSSTHAPQALALLNGRFANRLAKALAARLRKETGNDPAHQVELGFRLTAGRPPDKTERQLSLDFLRTQSLDEFALALFSLNAFLYVE